MKARLLSLLCTAICFTANSQPPLPVTGGLSLHLEAGSGYNTNPGPFDDVWHDKSAAGNNVSVPFGGNEPAFINNSWGTGFPAIRFTGNAFMESAHPANGWDFTDNVKEATLFVVRTAPPIIGPANMNALAGPLHTLISISEDHLYDNEFLLSTNMAVHHASSGNFRNQGHQCYTNLPSNMPVVLSGVLRAGGNAADINYYVNGIQSTTATFASTPVVAPYTFADRMIVIGARYDMNNNPTQFFDGDIHEVIAYNRALTPQEISQVNTWLQVKYAAGYSMSPCTNPVNTSQNCFSSANLSVMYTGNDVNGDCMFEAQLITPTTPGWTNISFDWSVPTSGTWFAGTSLVNFSVPPSGTTWPVTGNAYYSGNTAPFCCDISLTRNVRCQSGTGFVLP